MLILPLRLSLENVQYFVTTMKQATSSFSGMIEIHNCQYIACMNTTAGSFAINPRLQVWFELSYYSNPVFNP